MLPLGGRWVVRAFCRRQLMTARGTVPRGLRVNVCAAHSTTHADSVTTNSSSEQTDEARLEDEDYTIDDEEEEGQSRLYPTHIPTSLFQKVLLAVGSSAMGVLDPYRGDMVAVSGETTGAPVLPCLLRQLRADPEGQQILRDKPVINSSTVDLDALSKMAEGTLGRTYSQFLAKQHVTPDSRAPVRFVDDAELAYVIRRYRETHDLLHTVLDQPTNLLGEVTVKCFEGFQTGLPMCLGGGLVAPLRLKSEQRGRYLREHLPWAVRAARSSRLLLTVYWEQRWQQDLVQLRDELGLPPPPPRTDASG